jgi:hypothetical protein
MAYLRACLAPMEVIGVLFFPSACAGCVPANSAGEAEEVLGESYVRSVAAAPQLRLCVMTSASKRLSRSLPGQVLCQQSSGSGNSRNAPTSTPGDIMSTDERCTQEGAGVLPSATRIGTIRSSEISGAGPERAVADGCFLRPERDKKQGIDVVQPAVWHCVETPSGGPIINADNLHYVN